jgi:O-antigen ligase
VLSFIGLYHRYEGLASLAIYVGVVVLMVLLFRKRPDGLRSVAVAVGAGGAFVGAYVLLQKLGLDVTQWRAATGRAPTYPIGSLGNSAFSASYLGIAAPFVVYGALTARTLVRRAAWAGSLALIVVSLWFTQGRAGMVAAVTGVAGLVLFMSRLGTVQKLAVILATILALALVPVFFGDPTDTSRRDVLRTGTAGYRVQMWDAAWRIFLNRPILGWGPESFYGQYTRFRTPDEARAQGLSITDKPHNIFLGWATSTGAAGLAAWLILVGGALALVARRGARAEREARLLGATFGAGLFAYLAQGVYSIDVPPLALTGWVSIGAIAVLFERTWPRAGEDGTRRSTRRRLPFLPSPPWLAPAAFGGLIILLLAAGFAPLRADHAAWAAERRAALGWSTDTLGLYGKAIALNPREAAYRGLAGAFFERTAGNPASPLSREASLRRSVSYYQQALDIQPRNVYFMINLARVYSRMGREIDERWFAAGDRYLGRAVTLDPLNPQMHDLYADLLNQWAKEARGRERRELQRRAQTQAGTAQALRAGRVIR